MLIYILAIPVFSFALPIYSFWKQDDFSWGQTRVVLGEKGKKLVIHEEGTFDEKEIPLKSWHDYENELWERGSNTSIGQLLAKKEEAAYMSDQKRHIGEGSIYGHESLAGFPAAGYGNQRPHTSMSEMGARSFHQALNSLSSGLPPEGSSPYAIGAGGDAGGGRGYAQSHTGSFYGSSPYQSGGFGSQHFAAGGGGEFPTEGYELQEQTSPQARNPFVPRSQSQLSLANPFAPRSQSQLSLATQSLPLMQQTTGDGGEPSDEQLRNDITTILARADLQTLTKKGVREELESVSRNFLVYYSLNWPSLIDEVCQKLHIGVRD